MVTGMRPFLNFKYPEVLYKIAEERITPLSNALKLYKAKFELQKPFRQHKFFFILKN